MQDARPKPECEAIAERILYLCYRSGGSPRAGETLSLTKSFVGGRVLVINFLSFFFLFRD